MVSASKPWQLSRLISLACLTAPLFLGSFHAGHAETLRMGGTGAGLELLRKLGNVYTADHPELTVEIVPSLGTSGSLSALADGMIDLAVAARALKPEEAEKGLRDVTSARTPFLLVTSQQNPDSIKAADVAAAFEAPAPTWSNGELIRVILRPKSETDTRLLQEFFPGMPEALEKARSRPEIPVAPSDQDNARLAEELRGSLTGATLVQIVAEGRALRGIPIDGVEPTLKNFEAGRYPYGKTLHFVILEKPSAAVEGFVSFLTSEAAAPLMRQAGILPPGL
ncbi:MAG: PstS family phosphate ABC transporter substrate-binding protein [Hyphomicrobiales bacterium]